MSSIAAADPSFHQGQTKDDWMAKGGLPYRMIPDAIDRLPKPLQYPATVAYKATMRFLAKFGLDPRESTNPAMAASAGCSMTTLKKGLRILARPYELVPKPDPTDDVEFEKVELPPIIVRQRKHGLRRITAGQPLASKYRGDSPIIRSEEDGPPPAPPPENPGEKRGETTTTTTPSSSSLASLPGGDPELPPELLDAVGLVPGLSRERLVGLVRLCRGAELALRAVAWLRIWLRNPKAEHRPGSRGSAVVWMESAARSWRTKLDDGLETLAGIDEEIAAKVRQWGPKSAPKDDPAVQARREAEKAQEQAQAARYRRLREAWGLLPEGRREEIRAAVRPTVDPALHRSEGIMEPLYLAELGRRQAEPHRRE